MKNLRYDRKKLLAFFLALGFGFIPSKVKSDIISYNQKTTLTNGQEVTLYFITGDSVNDYAYISNNNEVGYISVSSINIPDKVNHDYIEEQHDLMVSNDTYIYLEPNTNKPIRNVFKNDILHVSARNNDGWLVITDNNFTGFIHESNLKEIEEVKKLIITGNNVNLRTNPNTNDNDNIIGQANNNEIYDVLGYQDGWYIIDYFGQSAYVSEKYSSLLNNNQNINSNEILMAKIKGYNVNVRYSSNTNTSSNIIGFCDLTDTFPIINKEGDWYIVDYFGEYGYINSKYIEEIKINESDTKVKKMVALKRDAVLYENPDGNYLSVLPQNQTLAVINEENGYYRVNVDSVIGYVKKSETTSLTNTFVSVELAKQIVHVYKNNKEVFRCHMISGCEELRTTPGIHTIGHKINGYQLTPKRYVQYWIEYYKHEGLHDAYWQKEEYFERVSEDAYTRYLNGKPRSFPYRYGSHGCDNLQLDDARTIFNLTKVGDNVVVMDGNNLIIDNLISQLEIDNTKVKKLV